MDELNLRTSIVRSDGDALPGRLGLLLLDESSDNVVALTAGQVARGPGPIFAHGGRIGVCSYDVDRSFDDKDRRPAWTLLEIVKLDKDVLLARPSKVLSKHRSPTELRLTRDLSAHLGEMVLVHSGTLAPREGLLRSLHALFRMPAPKGGESILFMDALMITSLDDEPLAGEGDAGALVTSKCGYCLGIVVAGIDGTSFAAPIEPLLADDALRPIDDDFVHEWNKSAWIKRLNPEPPAAAMIPTGPTTTPVVDTRNDDWMEVPEAMAAAGHKLAAETL